MIQTVDHHKVSETREHKTPPCSISRKKRKTIQKSQTTASCRGTVPDPVTRRKMAEKGLAAADRGLSEEREEDSSSEMTQSTRNDDILDMRNEGMEPLGNNAATTKGLDIADLVENE
ncbi:unnamed protein product [Microthlaspi erraticum]|uniref:Uncharacterized protein n=1 Tax=Microthlaspi erraticum TaxID=1685480 RepID=A0A6D2JRD7_9BRAS|nr:unnamed protein product [Microthlaspi erraticum]